MLYNRTHVATMDVKVGNYKARFMGVSCHPARKWIGSILQLPGPV